MTARLAIALWTFALVLSAGAITLVFTSDHEEAPFQVAALAVASGLAWIGSGLYAWVRRPENRIGALMTAVGFAWFLGALAESNISVLFTIGLGLGSVVWIFVVWLLLAYPTGRLETGFHRLLVGTTLALALVTPIPLLLVGDAETLIDCADCPENALLVEQNDTLANAQIAAQQVAAMVIVVSILVVLVRRWLRATLPQRRLLAPVYLTASALLGVILLTTAVDTVATAPDELEWLWLAGLLAIPLSFVFGLLRMRLATGDVPRMLREAIPEAPTPEQAQEGLRRVLRDSSLELAYSLPERGIYVDATGRPYELPAEGSGRVVTPLEYEGRRVGALVHDPALCDQPAFLENVVTVMRVAVERHRLQAELSVRVQELQALAEEQAALRRVAVAVATEQHPELVFDLVTEVVGRLLGAHWATTVRYTDDAAEAVVVGRWHEFAEHALEAGTRVELRGGAVTEVRRTGGPVRLDLRGDMSAEGREHMRDEGIASAVAAPVIVSSSLWGAVSAAVREPRMFVPGAEERIAKFADLIAVALANTEAREQLATLAQEQAALRRVAVVVASERQPQRVFDVVTEEVGRLLGADAANVIRFDDEQDEGLVIGRWSNGSAVVPLDIGSRLRFDGPTAVARVRRTGEPARVDALDEIEGELAARLRAHGIKCVVAAPIDVSGRLWGAVAVSSNEPAAFGPEAELRIGKFSGLVSLALGNAEAREQLAASRARIVHAGDTERRRLERDLHDGAQQRLVSLSIALRLARACLTDDPANAGEMLDSASEQLRSALEELRELARGIHPAVLTDRGLGAALEALATRSPVPVELETVPAQRLPEPVEVAAFYVVSESLANVAKYASAEVARIKIARQDSRLVVEVEDDGVGGADPAKGSGLRGLTDRVEALDGKLVVISSPGRGTYVRAEIPCA